MTSRSGSYFIAPVPSARSRNLDSPSITFLGAAGTVTGAKFLLEARGKRVLIDCGLFQGLKELRLRNWADPPFSPGNLDAVVLSHAHIDHSGYLPALVKRGFRGRIYSTHGTRELLKILLPDCARLEEEAAARANRHGYSKHRPALPLFTVRDAAQVIPHLRGVRYAEPIAVCRGITVRFRRAGHILGSASLEIVIEGATPTTVVYSGDLGRWDQPILRDPDLVARADFLLLESTYGDRTHAQNPVSELGRIVREAAARDGALLIPAFVVGRTQTLIWDLRVLEEEGEIPKLPVFIDSPMAHRVSEVYCRHFGDLDDDMTVAMDERRCPLCCKTYQLVQSIEQSKSINRMHGPLIVIAGSGMATGGRILHHLAHRLPDPRTTVLLSGFQAAGTRGRSLEDGASQVKMMGRLVDVKARIEKVDGLSGHADQGETLRWLRGFERPPAMTYVVHGEPHSSAGLSIAIKETLGWNVRPAVDGETVSLVREP